MMTETVVAIASSWTLVRVEAPNDTASPNWLIACMAVGFMDMALTKLGRSLFISSRIHDIKEPLVLSAGFLEVGSMLKPRLSVP